MTMLDLETQLMDAEVQRRRKNFAELDNILLDLLRDEECFDLFTYELESRRTSDWKDYQAVLMIKYEQGSSKFLFTVPVPKLELMDVDIYLKIRRKIMNNGTDLNKLNTIVDSMSDEEIARMSIGADLISYAMSTARRLIVREFEGQTYTSALSIGIAWQNSGSDQWQRWAVLLESVRPEVNTNFTIGGIQHRYERGKRVILANDHGSVEILPRYFAEISRILREYAGIDASGIAEWLRQRIASDKLMQHGGAHTTIELRKETVARREYLVAVQADAVLKNDPWVGSSFQSLSAPEARPDDRIYVCKLTVYGDNWGKNMSRSGAGNLGKPVVATTVNIDSFSVDQKTAKGLADWLDQYVIPVQKRVEYLSQLS